MSVHRAVMAMILVSCLLHTVEMLRELQFCTAYDKFG
jgi:hypothetical protein